MELKSTSPGQPIPSYADKHVDEDTYARLRHLVAPHVDSFNYFLEYGLEESVAAIPSFEFELSPGFGVKMTYGTAKINPPMRRDDIMEAVVTPREARESGTTYAGSMMATMEVSLTKTGETFSLSLNMGDLPIMVMSDKCHLNGQNSETLVFMKEEANEMGGYFILNGIERIIRLLQVPRRNYAVAILRSSFKNRGTSYSDKGVSMRCVRKDQSSATVTMHYLTNGGATLRFVLRKQEFLLPVVLVAKCLMEMTDKEFFDRAVAGSVDNSFLTTRLELLLRDFKAYGLFSQSQCLAYLGSLFRGNLAITDRTSDEEAGRILIQRFLFVHCDNATDKLECLLHMLRKLFAFAEGKCLEDNADALMAHDILLPGHLINMYVKEKFDEVFTAFLAVVRRDFRADPGKCESDCKSAQYFNRKLAAICRGIGSKVGTLLSTGNVTSSTGLDLMQASGFTVVAERLNIYRYMSHFQSVHRGQYFTNMKTTAVRKLLPESWGFLCPVHTPDGSPCGLLNHVARESAILAFPPSKRSPTHAHGLVPYPPGCNPEMINSRKYIQDVLVKLGMVVAGVGVGDGQACLGSEYVPVLLDGVVLGGVLPDKAEALVKQVRYFKAVSGNVSTEHFADEGVSASVAAAGSGAGTSSTAIASGKKKKKSSASRFAGSGLAGLPACASPYQQALHMAFQSDIQSEAQILMKQKLLLDPTMEVAYFPRTEFPSAYPGLYLSTQPGRMIRCVLQLESRLVEWIGPLEQVYMDIACLKDDIRSGETTHIELDPSAMLSQVAALTPFSDYNQSPRNMYQCQMGKQTMGTPAHALKHRSDNKLYRIQNVQAPIVQTRVQREYAMDEYPQGCNAVVAVISYTGYDMEDAMIINKSAFERGFGHGSVYKTQTIDLDELEIKAAAGAAQRPSFAFSNVKDPTTIAAAAAAAATAGAYGFGSPGSVNPFSPGFGAAAVDVDELSQKHCEELDLDGLPFEGVQVRQGEPLYCYVNQANPGEPPIIVRHKDQEAAYVQTVRIIGKQGPSRGKTGKASLRKISITLRYKRNPIIGDKFSSRHGQKGTLSVLWPQENMPFTESGMSPDVLINPHAFPSRMTIGMLIESMAGKSGSMHGMFQDGSPFQFHEEQRVIDYIGEQLRSCGYGFYGSEPLYNGLTGQVMQADIFIGVVYYQRLRHMVSDKSQVRSTGPVTALTRQPVKGRKKHGGIRLGEMERDALLSHGVAFCLQDRLMNCSDAHLAHVCGRCGGLLNVYAHATSQVHRFGAGAGSSATAQSSHKCTACGTSAHVQPVQLPYVFRYLANELAGMGVKLTLKLSD